VYKYPEVSEQIFGDYIKGDFSTKRLPQKYYFAEVTQTISAVKWVLDVKKPIKVQPGTSVLFFPHRFFFFPALVVCPRFINRACRNRKNKCGVFFSASPV
jgi:hypothetical protein